MVETFQNFFSKFSSFLDSVVNFVSSVINGFITIFKTLPLVKTFGESAIAYLPDFLKAFAIITIVISIAYLIVGRQTGGGD